MVRLFVNVQRYLCACIRFLALIVVMIVCARLPQALGQTFVYTNDNINGANTVTVFSVGSSGALTSIGSFLTGGSGTGCSPTCYFSSNRITIGGGGSFLYASDEGSNDVSAFSVNPVTGALTLVPGAPFPTGGSSFGGISLAATPDGRFLMAGSAGSANIAIFSIAANGALTLVSTFGPLSSSPLRLKVSPDGALLAVGNSGGTEVFKIAANGTLSSTTGSIGLSGEQGVDINCAGTALYAGVGNGTGVVDGAVLGINGLGGLLPGAPFPNGGLDSTVVLLSPAGQYLFASNLGGSVSVFSVASNGSLTQVSGSPFSVGSGFLNSGLAINPAGTFLFTANEPTGSTANSSISVFSIGTGGVLTPVSGSPFPVSGLSLMSIATFPASACSNPVPLINQPLVPDATSSGGPGFTLTVDGSGFVSTSVVNWKGAPLTTSFVTRNQLTATVPASNIATDGTASITVANPSPGGGTSNAIFFPVTSATASIALSKQDYATGVNPSVIAIGDFNRDGKLDLAVSNYCGGSNCLSASTVSILLGNGDGTFQAQHAYAVGTQPIPIVTADFNGDGKLDLAVANFADSTISILLGNGDGTFQPQNTLAVGTNPISVATGDFNGDGKLDLAVADRAVDTVSVLLGNGDGTFQAPLSFTTGLTPGYVVAGDFNGDGILDLAVANTGDGTVSILVGNGDGTFQTQTTFPAGANPYSVVAADFNGDGKLDLAVTNGGDPGPFTISVLLGNGNGTFQSPVAYATGRYPLGIALGELNGDDKLDLAVTNQDDSTVSVLLGNGDGTFQGQIVFPTTGGGEGIVTGDFNGDGRIDVVATNCCSGLSAISVFLQSPAVTLAPTSLNFGTQVVNTTSAFQQVSITNSGSATFTISNISITGANNGDFAATPCTLPTQVPPGASCNVQVTFTPLASGARAASLSITDTAPGSPQTVSLSGTGVLQLVVTTTSLPGGTVGVAYSQALAATGGTTPYTWSVSSGSLPAGLSLTAAGVISGTPTTAGTANFTVKVTDSKGLTATKPLSIVIVNQLAITTTSLPGGTVGVAYSQTLTATGGTTPYTWSTSSGSLPAGLSLTAAGVISGTPTTAGTSNFTAKVTDANGLTATKPFSIVIVAPLVVTTANLPGGTIGTAYGLTTLQASGGTGPYTWSVASGSLPPGLTLNSGGGLSGIPTTAGTFDFVVLVADANGLTAMSGSLSIVVVAPPNAPTCLPPTVTVNGTDPSTVTATSNCTDSQGTIQTTTIDWGDGTPRSSGTPASHSYAVAGSYTVTVTATDANGQSDTGSGNVTVTAAVATSVPQGQQAQQTTNVIAPLGVPTVQVTYQCVNANGPSGLQPLSFYHLSCNINGNGFGAPASVTLTSTPASVTVIVQTNSSAAQRAASQFHRVQGLYLAFMLLPGVVLLGIGKRQQAHKKMERYIGLVLLGLMMSGFAACGGGSLSSQPPPPQNTTPTGTYGVGISGTSTGSGGTNQTTVITVGFTVTIGG
ncbi:MAG TPA: FG-GAP-like repeat-containing protein [Candidatus Dormibacteraeota bacterium]|nr:FG-GAP-like repeat-containing protein [Candidatus Dormibacteraeota bacterium]